jgi:hypothetical protein
MIEYDRDGFGSGTMDIFCDGWDEESCNEVATYYGSWSDCIAQSKDDGWVSFRDETTDEWVHQCPSCKRPRVCDKVDEMYKD